MRAEQTAERNSPAVRVLRLCTAFMPPPSVLEGKGRDFDPIGGMQNHTFELTKALDARGVRQTVVTTRPPGAPWMQRVGSKAKVFRFGVPIRHMRQLYSVGVTPGLPVLAARADLVHVHLGEDLAVLPLARLAAAIRRLPLVMTVHCSLRHTLTVTDARTRVLKGLGGELERWTESRANAIIAITPRLAEKLTADGVPPERVHVIPPGVRPALFHEPTPSPWPELSGPKILFVGRLVPQKGGRVLLEAARRLRTPDAKVILIGDGPERPLLEQAARHHGVADRFLFRGFVPHDDVPAALAHADVLVLPSIYEELGSILIEAMQVGLPVVASRTGGVPDVVVDGTTGLLVPPSDPEALARALDRVLADASLAERLRNGARAAAEGYDWEVLADKVLAIYRSVLQGRIAAGSRRSRPATAL